MDAGGVGFSALCMATGLSCDGDSLDRFTYATSMDVSSSQMRVVKPQGAACQEEYRKRLKSPQRDQYRAGKTRHGKSPMTRSKPLGPCYPAGKKHQRKNGH